MNLSQSAQALENEKNRPRTSLGQKGLYVSFILLLIAGVSYGATVFYSSTLTKKKASISAQIDEARQKSYGDKDLELVSRFFVKSEEVVKKPASSLLNPKDELAVLSTQMLPEVVVTSYKNDYAKNAVTLSGKANEFRNVAEQMHVFKQSKNFSSVTTNILTTDKEGKILFTFDMSKSVSTEKK